MHSLMVASTRWVPSCIIWFWVTALGWTWVSPEIRSPCSTVGSTFVGGGGGLTSIRQVDEQPSPSTVLPSSHCSPASTALLPHTGSAGGAGGPQFSRHVPVSPSDPDPDPEPEPVPISGSAGLSSIGGCGWCSALVTGLRAFGTKSGSFAAIGPPDGAGGGGGRQPSSRACSGPWSSRSMRQTPETNTPIRIARWATIDPATSHRRDTRDAT